MAKYRSVRDPDQITSNAYHRRVAELERDFIRSRTARPWPYARHMESSSAERRRPQMM